MPLEDVFGSAPAGDISGRSGVTDEPADWVVHHQVPRSGLRTSPHLLHAQTSRPQRIQGQR